MKKILLLLAVAFALCSCGGNNQKNNSQAEGAMGDAEIIDVCIDSLIANPALYNAKTIRFTALVDHVCKHGGQKFTAVGTIPQKTIKVMGSEAVPSFEETINGAKVEVVGLVKTMAIEQVETCESDSTAQPTTYAVICNTIKVL